MNLFPLLLCRLLIILFQSTAEWRSPLVLYNSLRSSPYCDTVLSQYPCIMFLFPRFGMSVQVSVYFLTIIHLHYCYSHSFVYWSDFLYLILYFSVYYKVCSHTSVWILSFYSVWKLQNISRIKQLHKLRVTVFKLTGHSGTSTFKDVLILLYFKKLLDFIRSSRNHPSAMIIK